MSDGFTLKLTDTAELGRGEITEITVTEATENVNDLRFKPDACLRIHKVKSGGGSPTCNPVKGTF